MGSAREVPCEITMARSIRTTGPFVVLTFLTLGCVTANPTRSGAAEATLAPEALVRLQTPRERPVSLRNHSASCRGRAWIPTRGAGRRRFADPVPSPAAVAGGQFLAALLNGIASSL